MALTSRFEFVSAGRKVESIMVRSLLVLLLAVVCGVSAAIGALQLAPKSDATHVKTATVFVAAEAVRRGAAVQEAQIKPVEWPVDLVPAGLATNRNQIVGRSALSGIAKEEPFFQAKLSDASGSGFASNAIPSGMRACTIQTSGPSASVAGFVRPGDRVDVLLNLRGTADDETGGGSTFALLQSVEILAIDDILDVDSATVKMWVKEGLASVTVLVTPEQALQLSLGQAAGTLSLALRNGDDMEPTSTPPITIREIRDIPPPIVQPVALEEPAPDPVVEVQEEVIVEPPAAQVTHEQEVPPPTFIRTLRGTQSGQVRVVTVAGANN